MEIIKIKLILTLSLMMLSFYVLFYIISIWSLSCYQSVDSVFTAVPRRKNILTEIQKHK